MISRRKKLLGISVRTATIVTSRVQFSPQFSFIFQRNFSFYFASCPSSGTHRRLCILRLTLPVISSSIIPLLAFDASLLTAKNSQQDFGLTKPDITFNVRRCYIWLRCGSTSRCSGSCPEIFSKCNAPALFRSRSRSQFFLCSPT
jgi:hypothetical protein